MGVTDKIVIRSVAADESNFSESGYLSANPDIAIAVRQGQIKSGWVHFQRHGRSEGRRMRIADGDIAAMRQEKMNKLAPSLRKDMTHIARDGKFDYLTRDLANSSAIVEVENVSGHNYDPQVLELIEDRRGGLVLDCGAGRRDVYFPNVVNFEIVDYDTTDVLGVGEALPFEANSFDAVISIAVLEHVRDPFQCAKEIVRVLKPGGRLFCAMPFLQPMHGYPNHYFNATPQGLKRLFEDELDVEEPVVTTAFHPIWALSWILNSWARGLDDATRAQFLDMRVADLIGNPLASIDAPFVKKLSAATQRELACGSVLAATKPRPAAPSPIARIRGMLAGGKG